ncbi:MAG: SLC13 family permease, partial [Planctomycetota bacterium]|jgi:Na+/H+ antiporter NhaD/arsenite permease-like protein
MLLTALVGIVPAEEVFLGFGHPATLTVAMVLIISRGLQNAGVVDLMAEHVLRPLKSTTGHVGLLSSVAAALSALMNNVGALALLMPAAIRSAAAAKRPPASILMPLSFASILGGMLTLIGTPPNIIVAAVRHETAGTAFGMFDFTPVGGCVAVVGVLFVSFVGWRLIPKKRRARLSRKGRTRFSSAWSARSGGWTCGPARAPCAPATSSCWRRRPRRSRSCSPTGVSRPWARARRGSRRRT